jgi:peroxiredoxin
MSLRLPLLPAVAARPRAHSASYNSLAVILYYCQKQLVQLQADLKSLEPTGLNVVGISYDSVDDLAKFAEKRKITYPLLSDSGSKTIVAYGLLNKNAKGKTHGIPYPATIVMDGKGTVRAKLARAGYRERHTTEDLIKAAKEIPE